LPRSAADPIAELRSHFPEIFATESAETTWKKHLARFSSDQPYQLLSSAETERRLAELLRIKLPNPGPAGNYDLSQFPVFSRNKAARNTLVGLGNNLVALSTRAHPV